MLKDTVQHAEMYHVNKSFKNMSYNVTFISEKSFNVHKLIIQLENIYCSSIFKVYE